MISTSYKSGTTWMQNIVRQLVFQGAEKPPVSAVSPWLDRQNADIAATWRRLEAQEHRRFIKSHLPLDALPYFPEVRYIVVVRDPRDVFMSFWNHYSQMTDGYFERINAGPLEGPPMPRCPEDIHALWAEWINMGWFPWESEGWPHSGNLYHSASWWRFRHLENIAFVHFADLLADLPGEIARVAAHLGIDASPATIAAAARAVSFEALRRDMAAAGPLPEAAGGLDLEPGPRHLLLQGHQRALARGADRRRARHVRPRQGPLPDPRLRRLPRSRPRRLVRPVAPPTAAEAAEA